MNQSENACFNCDGITNIEEIFGYHICNSCKSKLGLFTDKKIKTYISAFEKENSNHSYEQEVLNKIIAMDKAYIKGRIKLLHILERIKHIYV